MGNIVSYWEGGSVSEFPALLCYSLRSLIGNLHELSGIFHSFDTTKTYTKCNHNVNRYMGSECQLFSLSVIFPFATYNFWPLIIFDIDNLTLKIDIFQYQLSMITYIFYHDWGDHSRVIWLNVLCYKSSSSWLFQCLIPSSLKRNNFCIPFTASNPLFPPT